MDICRQTGERVEGISEIAQRVEDVVTTPIGSRIMRRDYGSLIPELIDAPANAATRQRVIAATVEALGRWVPELTIRRVAINTDSNGSQWVMEITGFDAENLPVSIDFPLTRRD